MPAKTEQQSQSWEKRRKLCIFWIEPQNVKKSLLMLQYYQNSNLIKNWKKKLWYQNVEKYSVPLEIKQKPTIKPIKSFSWPSLLKKSWNLWY